mgnify:CR=1 FL=1
MQDQNENIEPEDSFLDRIKKAVKFDEKNLLNNLPLVFLIAVFGILHVANNHRIEKKIREINSLEKELKQLRWMYMTSKSELMFKSKQSEVAKMVEELGLEESVKAPYKIEVVED